MVRAASRAGAHASTPSELAHRVSVLVRNVLSLEIYSLIESRRIVWAGLGGLVVLRTVRQIARLALPRSTGNRQRGPREALASATGIVQNSDG